MYTLLKKSTQAVRVNAPEYVHEAFLVHKISDGDNTDNDRIIFNFFGELPEEDLTDDAIYDTIEFSGYCPTIAYIRDDGVYVAKSMVSIDSRNGFDSYEDYVGFEKMCFLNAIEDGNFDDWYDGTTESIALEFKSYFDFNVRLIEECECCCRTAYASEEYIVFRDGTDPHIPLTAVVEREMPDVIEQALKCIKSCEESND